MNAPTPRPNDYSAYPDARGRFGEFGGRYVAETLMPLVLELEREYARAKADPAFQTELRGFLTHYVGRPSPLYFAERLTTHFGGAKIYLKREELNHTGAHKINNCMGQILLARRMASFMASFRVAAPEVTGLTVAPSRFMRKTLGFCRSTSTAPM
jgi:tryptophan synthase beta chain